MIGLRVWTVLRAGRRRRRSASLSAQWTEGCTSPCAAHARVEGNELKLSGLYYDEKTGRYVKGSLCAGH